MVPSRKFTMATEATAMDLLLGPASADSTRAVTAITPARRQLIRGRHTGEPHPFDGLNAYRKAPAPR